MKNKKTQRDVEFVNYSLSQEQKRFLKAQQVDYDNELLRVIERDIKVTFSYDSFNECFSCFFIPTGENENKGLILAGRGSTPLKSFKQALFIDSLFEGVWSAARPPRREEIDD